MAARCPAGSVAPASLPAIRASPPASAARPGRRPAGSVRSPTEVPRSARWWPPGPVP